MPNRSKKEGDVARTQARPAEERPAEGRSLPVQRSDVSQPPAREAAHPLARLRDEMDALFDRFFTRWPAPAEWDWGLERMWGVDVEDTDKEILVRAEAPGFEPKDFDIHVSGNMLTIRAEHRHESEQKEGQFRSWERRYGRFQRMIPLPAAIDADKVEAHYHNGVLKLRLPRTEEAQRRRIEVKGQKLCHQPGA
jgi:HSP20 family protein